MKDTIKAHLMFWPLVTTMLGLSIYFGIMGSWFFCIAFLILAFMVQISAVNDAEGGGCEKIFLSLRKMTYERNEDARAVLQEWERENE